MKRRPIEKKAYHFPEVSVLVPDQNPEIVAVDWTHLIPEDLPEETEGFIWIRNIANIVLFRKDDFEFEDPVKNFSPPIEFRVHYKFEDVKETDDGDINQLKLAYWDEENEKWVIISDLEHEYQILPPSTAQVAEAKIGSWNGDPTLAWGK